ncbi:MAG TPA: Hsp20/alpha crystallin family protein [Sunxiuqinia sp.]|nr:Hsp20/alpha crystallin family protein [Sunxiuqinia sp.]
MKLVNVNRPVYRYNPVDQLMNDFFNNNHFADRLEQRELGFSPKTNLVESDDKIVLELLVPGFEKDQIKLSVENNVLTVKSNLEEQNEKSDELKYSRVEFEKQNFEKSFKLSDKLDQEKINADFKNGILTITLAKKEEAIPVKRQIEIA